MDKIINYYVMFVKNYVNFNGRSNIAEFWIPTGINVGVFVILSAFVATFRNVTLLGWLFVVIRVLFLLFIFIPSLANIVRRLHDTGKSWMPILWILLPLAGLIILIVYLARPTVDANVYGVPGDMSGASASGVPYGQPPYGQPPYGQPQPPQYGQNPYQQTPQQPGYAPQQQPLQQQPQPGQRKVYPQPPQANDPYAPAPGQPQYPGYQPYQQPQQQPYSKNPYQQTPPQYQQPQPYPQPQQFEHNPPTQPLAPEQPEVIQHVDQPDVATYGPEEPVEFKYDKPEPIGTVTEDGSWQPPPYDA